jgi:hypothetical protein
MPFRTPPPLNHKYYDVSDLNARWDQIPLQGLGSSHGPKQLAAGVLSSGVMGSLSAMGATQQEQEMFPWGEYSEHTRNIQVALNVYMDELGYRDIAVDGVLGPETCAAMKAVSPGDVVGTCKSYGTLQKKDVAYAPPPTTDVTPAVVEAGMGDTAWIIIGGLVAAGAVGAAVWYKKKKGR